MPMLIVTEEELRAATVAIYGLEVEHAPRDVWVDHFDENWSYVRATFPTEFCGKCATRLLLLVKMLRESSGNDADATIVVYMGDNVDTLAEDRQAFVRNRLAGIKRRPP
jgi:hypothetical protein